MGNEFGCFPSSQVACYWVIMVSLHNFKSELAVTRDIDLSSIEYYTILFLPLVAMQPSLGAKFFQGLDN